MVGFEAKLVSNQTCRHEQLTLQKLIIFAARIIQMMTSFQPQIFAHNKKKL